MTGASGESPFVTSDLREVMPENPIRVIVTGWRAWPIDHRQFIWNELDGLWGKFSIPWERGRIVIVHGQCPYGGVDLHAESWAKVQRQQWEQYPAEERNGKLLGPERNAKMVALGANLCIGFPGPRSRGTWDCLRKATDAGIENYSKSWFPGIKS